MKDVEKISTLFIFSYFKTNDITFFHSHFSLKRRCQTKLVTILNRNVKVRHFFSNILRNYLSVRNKNNRKFNYMSVLPEMNSGMQTLRESQSLVTPWSQCRIPTLGQRVVVKSPQTWQ